jgi:chemotaxis protein MotB
MSKGHRKKAHAAEHENSERWLLTYADLITLLMVFFVVLYSMSSADTTKFKLISAALQQAFNLDVLQGQSAASLSDGAAQMSPPLDTMISPSDVPQVSQIRNKIQGALDGAMQGATQAPDVSVGVDSEGIVIRLSGSYLFDSGRAELKPNSLAVLDAIATVIRPLENEIRVDGHTDSTPIDSPRYPTNWELSVARAVAVTRYMAETDGVRSGRLIAAGFGEFRPLVPNDTRLDRAQNRRVEIHLLSSAPPDTGASHETPLPQNSQPITATEHLE